jgi:hypothetical protein
MKIHIEGDIYLSSNGADGKLGYSLERFKGTRIDRQRGEVEVWDNIGNYSSIENALNIGILKLKIDASTATTLKELIIDVQRIRTEINAILGGI